MSSPLLPPPLPASAPKSASPILAALLSVVLALFLVSGILSFLSDSLVLFFGRMDLVVATAPLFLLMLFMGALTCGLLALFPGIPKRIFLPASLYLPVVGVAILPLFVFFYRQAALISWAVSLSQILLALFLIRRVQGGWKFRWPMIAEQPLAERKFSWGNLLAVFVAGAFLLLPALALSMAFSARLAVAHFTDGFVALQPQGITVQVRKYVRDDGKTVLLVPMSHVGEPKFYLDLAASFPANSVILMEGVSDHRKVANSHLDYSRAAASVGGVEQTKVFKPQGELVPADVDMSSFSPETLEVLKTAMLVHAKGVTAETLPLLMKPTPPGMELLLMEDLLTKRNRHLLNVLEERLPKTNSIIVPWGAAHMPEIAREIQKLGFRVVETQDYLAIRFGS